MYVTSVSTVPTPQATEAAASAENPVIDNCPYCGTKLESEQPFSVMRAHPLGKGCPLGGDYLHTIIWEKHHDALRHYNVLQAGKALAS